MSAPVITLKNASVTFGGGYVFENISLSIDPKDRISLVGRNGCGKSTLLKVLAEIQDIYDGDLFVQPGSKIGYLPQELNYDRNITAYEFILDGLKEEDYKYKADFFLSQFFLTGNEKIDSLSGGQKRHISLIRAVISEPDLLLLDEPTNHLDIQSIEWLENFLYSYSGAVICISHDRKFLSNISSKIFWMYKGGILVNKKGYSDFERWSEMIFEQEKLKFGNLEKELERENQWLAKGVTARRKRNVRRLKELMELRQNMKNEKILYRSLTSKVSLHDIPENEASKILIEASNVSYSFDNKKILDDFSFRLIKKDKIGILGKNGSGKTTFLNIITKQIPIEKGVVKFGCTVEKFNDQLTIYDQKRNSLDPKKTPWEVLCPTGGDRVLLSGDRTKHVVGYLKDFMFTANQVKSPCSLLSGGEAGRLMLAKVLANPGNVLILDEPTNDLDVETLDVLQDILGGYKGTLLLVSHDRDFIDRIVNKTIIFEGDGEVEGYVGGYSDYLAQRKHKSPKTKNINKNKEKVDNNRAQTKELKVLKKLSYKDEYSLKTLPSEINNLTNEIKILNEELNYGNLFSEDPKKFNKLLSKLADKQKKLSEKENKWLEIEALKEKILNDNK